MNMPHLPPDIIATLDHLRHTPLDLVRSELISNSNMQVALERMDETIYGQFKQDELRYVAAEQKRLMERLHELTTE
jgi:hypothetical protein